MKVPGESVLFSNLIKNDDGVLRSLLAANGYSDMEAAAAIDRFVFEVRIRLQNNGICRLGGFGELRSGANETLSFTYTPTVQDDSVNEDEQQSAAEPSAQQVPEIQPSYSQAASSETADVTVQSRQSVSASQRAAVEPEPVQDHASDDYEIESRPRQEVRQDTRQDRMKSLYDDGPRITPSPKNQPADYVKGLRYGKGRKSSSYDRDFGSRSRRRNDRILIIAIVAAVLAIAALGYGYYCDLKAARMDNAYSVPDSGQANPDLEYIETPNE